MKKLKVAKTLSGGKRPLHGSWETKQAPAASAQQQGARRDGTGLDEITAVQEESFCLSLPKIDLCAFRETDDLRELYTTSFVDFCGSQSYNECLCLQGKV
jgi:hypothetical protein